ncbi:MAG: hypothetical protein GTN81_16205 [Proteobacteria bacterium]|nr:hypothetical protein [Pseudomonadota bacterium]
MNEVFPYNSDFVEKLGFAEGILSSLRSHALAVTLSRFAGGESLPLPRSKGGAFPFLLTCDGTPPLPLTSLRDKRIPYN